jgi:hypothetical protein
MRLSSLAAFTAVLIGSATVAVADPRPFTFTSDTYAVGKGGFEYEQWLTWRHHKDEEPGFDRYDIRHEFEFGIADNFDLAVYLPSWRYEDSQERKGTKFDSVDIEAIVYFLNPRKDFIGLGLYNEIKVGEEFLGFETKLLVQKDIGQWVFAYNLVLETNVEGVFDNELENEVEGELKHSVGISYAVTPGLLIGVEAFVESVYADWSVYEKTTVYAGPVISFQGHEHFWFTLTGLYQLSSEADEPDFRVRLIAGWQY